jgi:predicted nucleic acid-binding protein
MKIMTNTEEYNFYHELVISPQKGQKIIGRGEAAALALAKVRNGIIASNNLKDISRYVSLYNLDYVTTCDILVEALNKELIDESLGNKIWNNMLQKRRLLPASTFSDYLKSV